MPELPEVIAMRENCEDRDYVINAVKENGKLLDFAAERFHNDREIVFCARIKKAQKYFYSWASN